MKRIACFLLLFVFLSPRPIMATASRGLILQNGASVITIRKGEKRILSVRNGKTVFSRPAGLTFLSDAPLIASVGLHNGIIRGNGYGEALIIVTDRKGNTGRIRVRVVTGKSLPLWFGIFLLSILLLAGYWILQPKKRA